MAALEFARAPDPEAGPVVTKAVLRASAHLGLSNRLLGRVLGISEASVSRMSTGAYALTTRDKAYELAVLFLRLFRSLDAIVAGDTTAARAWLQQENDALGGIPASLIQSVTGLVNVVGYLDARRAHV